MNIHKGLVILLMIICVSVVIYNYFLQSSKGNKTCQTHKYQYTVIQKTIVNNSFSLLTADSISKQTYGLMNIKNRKDICEADGMIFRFPFSTPQSFWNKDTLVDLDVYWMRGDKVIEKTNLPAISKGFRMISSPSAVDTVVEIIQQ